LATRGKLSGDARVGDSATHCTIAGQRYADGKEGRTTWVARQLEVGGEQRWPESEW
jgi:hypothetical protein